MISPQTDCEFYFSENPEKVGDFRHDSNDLHGFCIIKDLFSECYGKCGSYKKSEVCKCTSSANVEDKNHSGN